ncbi:uncharacterized protein LOC115314759 [Ixodes scapularis]|uniref:uncharacterized protein LOC115314759 n=1 Tax=Ixodes scapularis TaxID=6945 RepID=UPI001C3897BF|nr:uncharacterized protein LOC115314759 [Ixodes scapularis]
MMSNFAILVSTPAFFKPKSCGLCLSPTQARALERDTRQQAKSPRWHKELALRLTASNFGVAATREVWSQKGLHNLTSTRDLSRVPAIRHGITQEPIAVQRYMDVLQSLGHSAIDGSCGIFVDSSTPWLGASPDRIVFDPTEVPPHGVLEVKCPKTLYDKSVEELKTLKFCSEIKGDCPELRRTYDYNDQVLGQMAIAGLQWGDFVVFGDQFILVERIRFCPDDWSAVSMELQDFYFDQLLPHLELLR